MVQGRGRVIEPAAGDVGDEGGLARAEFAPKPRGRLAVRVQLAAQRLAGLGENTPRPARRCAASWTRTARRPRGLGADPAGEAAFVATIARGSSDHAAAFRSMRSN